MENIILSFENGFTKEKVLEKYENINKDKLSETLDGLIKKGLLVEDSGCFYTTRSLYNKYFKIIDSLESIINEVEFARRRKGYISFEYHALYKEMIKTVKKVSSLLNVDSYLLKNIDVFTAYGNLLFYSDKPNMENFDLRMEYSSKNALKLLETDKQVLSEISLNDIINNLSYEKQIKATKLKRSILR